MTRVDQPFPWVGLFTLSALIFTSVTSEFLPTGLLPDMARELQVSESQIGLLVTLFAGTVVVTAAPLTALTRNHSRKALVMIALLVFVFGSVLAAIAPTYEVLAVARIIGGLAHGLFWAVVGAYTAHLVPADRIGRAVAITSSGATAAFVLGVPLGTALGHALGWRLAFAVIGGIIVVLMVVAARFLPAVQHIEVLATGEIAIPLRKDRSIPGIVVVCVVVLLVIVGHNIFYTYIASFLISPVGFDAGAVAVMLLVYGGAGAFGLVLAGMLTDRFPRSALIVAVGGVALAVLVIGLFPATPWVVVVMFVLWGAAFGGAPAMLQSRMLHTASPRMRDTASAYLTTSFNVGIGGGALIGGILLDRSDITVLPFVDVAVLVLAIVVAIIGDAWLRRHDAAHRMH
ncbi:MAG: transporter [Rhodoglobus sp.]|nr:transporter [Rhodoglobus sp.]